MPNYPTYWLTPANWSLDTSFEQWSGFNKQVLWVAEYWDEYVFWWDNGSTYYSAYNWISNINANKIAPLFRVNKTTLMPDIYSNIGWNMNNSNSLVNNAFTVMWWYIYVAWAFTKYGNNDAQHLLKLDATDMSFVSWNTGVWFSIPSSLLNRSANWKIFVWRSLAITYNWGVSSRLQVFNDDLTLDTTLTNFFLPNNAPTCVFEQADGKVIISWTFTTIWWTTQNRIVRYNTDWTVDTTFTTNVWTWPSAWATTIAQLSDWKLVLWWTFTTFNGTASQRIIILNTDWTIATAVASWFSSTVNTIVVDWSDNIYVGWSFSTFAGTGRVWLAKLSSTLTLDWTYNAVMSAGSQVYSLQIDWTTLYIWTGSARTTNGITVNWIFSTDLVNWTLVSNMASGINANVRNVYIDSSYIYIYGATTTFTYWWLTNYDWQNTICYSYIDKNGKMSFNLDKFTNSWSFNSVGYIKDWTNVYTILTQTTGYWLSTTKWVAKFIDNKIDLTYTATLTSSIFSWIYDNWIIVVWTFTSPKNRIVKLDATGATDAIFDVWTGFGAQADWITKLSNWNYLVTWDYTTYKWVTTNRICVLDNVGTKVWTFVEWTWLSSTPSAKSLQLSNWNYLIYGNMTTYKWTACNRAIILDATGTQVSWLASNFNSIINKAVEHNGKVYFTWNFTTFWATTVNRIACIDLATWTLVNIFWTGLNWTWNDIIVDNWGKLLVVWNFTTYNDNPVWYVARIFI